MSGRVRRLSVAAVAVVALAGVAGCNQGDGSSNDAGAEPGSGTNASNDPGEGAGTSGESTPTEQAPVAQIKPSIADGSTDVKVDSVLSVNVADGSFDKVKVVGPDEDGKKSVVGGKLNADKTAWTANGYLQPRARYVVKTVATGSDDQQVRDRSTFTTQDLDLKTQETYPSVYPTQGDTVGVGMPVIVKFDVPVKNHAAFEKRMHVSTQPSQAGSWSWISDYEVHWRPRHWWKAGTKVDVTLDLNSVAAGDGVYGQMDRHYGFTVGDDLKLKINLKSDYMKVVKNGKVVRQIPVTGGNADHPSRSGIKLISEKYDAKRMNSATVGIDPNSSDGYNIANVQWAQRVTNSGEFLHAAPWSEYAQGSENVSHGCIGMSTDNAKYVYDQTLIGTPVITTGTSRGIEPQNGWTDWEESWQDFKAGSALH